MDKNKQNMLIFGGYALIMYMSISYSSQIFPISHTVLQVVYLVANISFWVSVGYFVIILWRKVISFFSDYLKVVKKMDEE